jgi:hypothetical protein
MNIFIDQNKGDYIYRDWEEESIKEMNLKFKELQDLGFEEYNVEIDYLNTYYYYRNNQGKQLTVTLLCS